MTPMAALRRFAVILFALPAAGCAPYTVLSREESQAKLTQHRKAYEWLAAEMRACGLERLEATGQATDRCVGKADKIRLQTAMQTLGVKRGGYSHGAVWLITGTDGSESTGFDVSVASYLIQTDVADATLPDPLTAAPHRWFYAVHD